MSKLDKYFGDKLSQDEAFLAMACGDDLWQIHSFKSSFPVVTRIVFYIGSISTLNFSRQCNFSGFLVTPRISLFKNMGMFHEYLAISWQDEWFFLRTYLKWHFFISSHTTFVDAALKQLKIWSSHARTYLPHRLASDKLWVKYFETL